MLHEKRLRLAIIFFLLVGTHLATYLCGCYSKQVKSCIKVVYFKEVEAQTFGVKEDGQIHVGVAISNDLLSDDEIKNQAFARTFIVKNNYELIHTEKYLLPENKVFVFKFLRNDNKLTSK